MIKRKTLIHCLHYCNGHIYIQVGEIATQNVKLMFGVSSVTYFMARYFQEHLICHGEICENITKL